LSPSKESRRSPKASSLRDDFAACRDGLAASRV
jgi:hypothetical protein